MNKKGKARMNTMEDVASAHMPNERNAEQYDVVILGGGTGSTIAAWTFAA
jgi:hypothetical protein